MWWGYAGFHPFGGFFFLLLIGLVVVLLVSRRHNGWSHRGEGAGLADAEAILRRRLASGEISEAEYRALREVLYG
ncbi:MAG: SHOCT domain-containing protein [Chloroflexota bacterium]